jgi:outer membrane protein
MAALALAAKEFRVGYVDTDRVIAKYEAAVDAKKQLDAEISKFEARADSLKSDYEQAKQEYESQQLTLSEEGKRAKLAEVEQRKKRYESYLNEVYGRDGRIEQKNKELIAPIVEKIDSAVARLAAEEGFALVVDAAKAGIVYSQAGLDLTQLVIEELNREYTPVATTQQKVNYAVVKIWDMNELARQERVGETVRGIVYDFVEASPQAEMVAVRKLDDVATERNLIGQQLQLEQALEVARAVSADYVVYGFCSKRDRKVTFELSIADVRLSTALKTQQGEADRPEVLREQVAAIVRVLLSSVTRQ